MLDKIKRNLKKVDDNELYSPKQIAEMGLILNTEIKSSVFTIYRLIRKGLIKTINVSSGDLPQYKISGKDLRGFIKKRYNL